MIFYNTFTANKFLSTKTIYLKVTTHILNIYFYYFIINKNIILNFINHSNETTQPNITTNI
jgi:hypothetical protein